MCTLATAIFESVQDCYSREELSSDILDKSFWSNYDRLMLDAAALDGISKDLYDCYDFETKRFNDIPASIVTLLAEVAIGYDTDDSRWRTARLHVYLSRLGTALSKEAMAAFFTYWRKQRKKQFMTTNQFSARKKSGGHRQHRRAESPK